MGVGARLAQTSAKMGHLIVVAPQASPCTMDAILEFNLGAPSSARSYCD